MSKEKLGKTNTKVSSKMYRSSSSNNNNHLDSLQKLMATTGSNINKRLFMNCEDHCVYASQDGKMVASDKKAYTMLRCSHSIPYQIPSIEAFRSWEQSRGRLPWNSNLLTTEKAVWPCHNTSKKPQKQMDCDLTLSISMWEEVSSDTNGSSMISEEVTAPSCYGGFGSPAIGDHFTATVKNESNLLALNMDLTISSSWLT